MKATWPVPPTMSTSDLLAGQPLPGQMSRPTRLPRLASPTPGGKLRTCDWILIVFILVNFEIKFSLSVMPTLLFLIIVSLLLEWFLIPSTTRGETSPSHTPGAPEHISLTGRYNFRYPLLISPYTIQTSLPLTDRGASSYGKQSCPHTFTCGRD